MGLKVRGRAMCGRSPITGRRLAVLEFGIVGREPYMQQSTVTGRSRLSDIQYVLVKYQPIWAFGGYRLPCEVQHQFLGLVTETFRSVSPNRLRDGEIPGGTVVGVDWGSRPTARAVHPPCLRGFRRVTRGLATTPQRHEAQRRRLACRRLAPLLRAAVPIRRIQQGWWPGVEEGVVGGGRVPPRSPRLSLCAVCR